MKRPLFLSSALLLLLGQAPLAPATGFKTEPSDVPTDDAHPPAPAPTGKPLPTPESTHRPARHAKPKGKKQSHHKGSKHRPSTKRARSGSDER